MAEDRREIETTFACAAGQRALRVEVPFFATRSEWVRRACVRLFISNKGVGLKITTLNCRAARLVNDSLHIVSLRGEFIPAYLFFQAVAQSKTIVIARIRSNVGVCAVVSITHKPQTVACHVVGMLGTEGVTVPNLSLDFLVIDGIVDEMETRPERLKTKEVEDESFELVYIGPDLDTGTMSAWELTEVFTGITKCFTVISHDRGLGDQYELRVRDIDHHSFHLVFEAVAFAKANPVAAGVDVAGATLGWNMVKDTVSGIYKVVTDLAKTIDAKLTAKGEHIGRLPAQFSEEGVIVEGPDGPIELTKEQYELLLNQRIDKPLAQIVSPLAHDRVDRFELRSSKTPIASVEVAQKDYFDYQEVDESKTREGTEIVGTLNSFNKTNLRGSFHTVEGMHVPYRYSGGDVNKLLRGFAAKEAILARGKVQYAGDGTLLRVDIQDLYFIQQSLSLG